MSRVKALDFLAVDRFPRVSGDEPGRSATVGSQVTFSPRERG